MKEIVLHLDEATARDLHDAIYMMGEHIAAGMEFPVLPTEFHLRLRAVMDDLSRQLGRGSMTDAMEAHVKRMAHSTENRRRTRSPRSTSSEE